MFQGLRTVIYHAPDLDKAKAWYTAAFGVVPYFDEPFYVGQLLHGTLTALPAPDPATLAAYTKKMGARFEELKADRQMCAPVNYGF